MADRSRNIFVLNDGQDRHKITQQWSLHAQVTLSNGKPERSFEYQRGNIVFTAKPPGDSGYGSGKEDRYSPPHRRGGFSRNQYYANNQFLNNQAFSNNRYNYSNTGGYSNGQGYDKKCFNSCKVTVDCNHHGSSSLYPGAHHTFTVTTEGSHSPSGQDSGGLCEICSGVGSHSPTTARRREQFTSHFCTRVPEKRPPRGLSKDASIQTSFASVPDELVEEDTMTKTAKTSKKSTIHSSSKQISSSVNRTPIPSPDVSPQDPPKSNVEDKFNTKSTKASSTTCLTQSKSRCEKKASKEVPCPLTKLKRQTLSSGSLRKCPNLLMHSSTSAVQKYSNLLSPKPLRKGPTTTAALNNCDNIGNKPEHPIAEQVAKSWRTCKSTTDSGAGSSATHSICKDESLDSLKNGCDVTASDLIHCDTASSLQSGSSCSTISCSDCSYNSDSMSDTSDSSTLEDGSVSRSDSFEYADSFEYDDSFDKLRIEEKEKTWRKKGNNDASASKDQIRHQKFAEYLMKRSTTSPFPSWKSSNVSISTVYSEDDDTASTSSSSSSISDDGSMSELGWSFASKCNNPTRLNSLNSVTSSVFDKKTSSRKIGPQKMDSLDSGSYSDSSQQTFCSQISVGKRESSVPKQIPSSNSSFSKAEKFGPVVGSLRKPGHHIGPSKNPNCSCATCVAHFESVESGKAKTRRTESCDSLRDSDCSSGLDWDPTCEVR